REPRRPIHGCGTRIDLRGAPRGPADGCGTRSDPGGAAHGPAEGRHAARPTATAHRPIGGCGAHQNAAIGDGSVVPGVLLAIPANRRLLPLYGGLAQRAYHLVRGGLGDLHEREPVGDLDRPDLAAADPGLPGDGPDQVTRADPDAAARAHE